VEVKNMQKISIKALGLSFGIVWSFLIFFSAILAMWCGRGTHFVSIFADFYYGYNVTFIGSIIGAIWGFIDGFVCGILIAWLYNKFARV
jgi:hypothetical protein